MRRLHKTFKTQTERHRPGLTKLLHLSHLGISSEKILSARQREEVKVPVGNPGLQHVKATQSRGTFHPVQVVLLATTEADTVGRVERSVSFNQIVPLEAGYALQSVNILSEQTRINVNMKTVALCGKCVRMQIVLPANSSVSGAPCPSTAS